MQNELFTPTHAGGWAPAVQHSDTSKQAASKAVKYAGKQEQMVAEALQLRAMTDEEIYRHLIDTEQITHETKESSIRRARVGLVNRGMACDSGETRKLASGRNGTVWTWSK